MHETRQDFSALQKLLDASRSKAGTHLREVFSDELALTAKEIADRLTGVRVLAVATVTAAGEPLVAPVDGIFYRAHVHFGSSPDSVRLRHLSARPSVSAAYVEGEQFAIVVHGRAVRVGLADPMHRGFRDCLVEVYEPRFGPGWIDRAAASATYFRIEPRRMFGSRLPG